MHFATVWLTTFVLLLAVLGVVFANTTVNTFEELNEWRKAQNREHCRIQYQLQQAHPQQFSDQSTADFCEEYGIELRTTPNLPAYE